MKLNPKFRHKRIVALAGGVGGAKLAHGLAQVIIPEDLTVVVNVGDDFEHFGLKICPDLDTVCYTLAGIANPITGWGLKDESFAVIETLGSLGGPDWFRLGDRDLATHLERTRLLKCGKTLSQITADFCKTWSIKLKVLPATDDCVPTMVHTSEGILPFQEYFVYHHCNPRVTGFEFTNIRNSRPSPGVIESLEIADLVVICPSNPFVSIDPILALPGIRQTLLDRIKANFPVIAVSPIIGGQTVKGPAAKMFSELGIQPSALTVAQHFQGLINGFVLDSVDQQLSDKINSQGVLTWVTNTLMTTDGERSRLAVESVNFGLSLTQNVQAGEKNNPQKFKEEKH